MQHTTHTGGEVASFMPLFWLGSPSRAFDLHAAFRATFSLDQPADAGIHVFGAHWFVAWLDGEFLTEGPARFEMTHPEFESIRVALTPGWHCLAAQVHNEGISTRILDGGKIPPFFGCRIVADHKDVPISWKCAELPGFAQTGVRINGQLAWVEWDDTRKDPMGWALTKHDDSDWQPPKTVSPPFGPLLPLSIARLHYFRHTPEPCESGAMSGDFNYKGEDLPWGFFRRDLYPEPSTVSGTWWRFDLGRVRLSRALLRLDVPPGTEIEIGYAENLIHKRVAPYIVLSCSTSSNMHHFVARGGEQEFGTLTPLGGRFVEVHVNAPPDKVMLKHAGFIERCYHDAPEGMLKSGSDTLDRIWTAGVETLRACAEDALIDNPTRERGQWTGDAVTVGLGITSVAYSDCNLIKRAIRQSAWCARKDGMIAGLNPGGCYYHPTYALMWVTAVVEYHTLTGDRALLEEMYDFAVQNLEPFLAVYGDSGVRNDIGHNFIDWGYLPEPADSDMAVNMHFIESMENLAKWDELLDRGNAPQFRDIAVRTRALAGLWLNERLDDTPAGWDRIGYHIAALALRLGFLSGVRAGQAVEFLKSHILSCFPNNPDAPRLNSPEMRSRQLITPYFAHYAFPELIERGEMDFVLGQYEKCWGWALSEGRTTIVEVFDLNWTHCHQWAGCPTWQMSRYLLGLWPRYDLGRRHFELRVVAGSWPGACGSVPLPFEDGVVNIAWKRANGAIEHTIETEKPIWLHLPDANAPATCVEGRFTTTLVQQPQCSGVGGR
ncbi:MAG: hypothetical protein WCK89_19565 [bacterium]